MAPRTPVADRSRFPIHALLLLALVALAYLPGLHGPFVFDDGINITANPVVAEFEPSLEGLRTTFKSGRPLAYLSLALNHVAAGADTFAYKLTNLLIHLVNVALVYWLCTLLVTVMRRERADKKLPSYLPLTVAALWAIHPLQLTSVLYVVQRMTSLSALCVLAGLIIFLYGRELEHKKDRRGIPVMWLGILAGTIVGVGFKENATLTILYAAVIELTLYRAPWRNARARRRLLVAYGAPAALLVLGALWLWMQSPSDVYSLREFTPLERLLTQARVLWFYVSLIVFPAIDRFALFHDDIALSKSLITPWTTLLAVGALIAVVAASFWVKQVPRMFTFAVLWFLAGQAIESSFIGLELVHEHRNYLPSLGPIFALAYALTYALESARRPALRTGVWLLLFGTLGVSTATLAHTWGDRDSLIAFLLQHHPLSARTQVMAADRDFTDLRQPLPAIRHYAQAAELGGKESAFLIRAVYVAAQSELPATATGIIHLDELSATDWTLVRDANRYRIRPTSALLDRIVDRLTHQPVHGRTAMALEEITSCIVQQPAACGFLLDHAIRWHETAIDNARSNDYIRTELLTHLVQLRLERHDLAGALVSTQRARALNPADPALAAMEANVRLLAGDLAGATEIVDALLAHAAALTPEQLATANALRRMLDATPATQRSRTRP